MTLHATVKLTCANCQHESKARVLLSTNSLSGSRGLDTRVSGMARSAMLSAIQHCQKCHYCYIDITRIHDSGKAVIYSQAYQDTFNDKRQPLTCRKWSCYAQFLEIAGQYSQSGWAFLSAAWSCDDSRETELASKYRREAIRLFQTAQRCGDNFCDDLAMENTILVDLFRRTHGFETAKLLAEEVWGLIGDSDSKMMRAIIQFQIHLASLSNAGSYSCADAASFVKNPKKWLRSPWWKIWH